MEVGIVVIGRNEGERFKACLNSLIATKYPVVYVDSGSTDGSLQFAAEKNVKVVQLNTSRPFSAGRARNLGFETLLIQYPEIKYVQFIDGDCTLDCDWISTALAELERDDSFAIVCGRRREKLPHKSIYNQMCDIEWDTPIGETKSCGGDFLARVSAIKEVRGFNQDVIAGEEPEMCLRLRQNGWFIKRISAEMTLHDAAITQLKQYWKRSERCGHAYAQGVYLHGLKADRFRVKELSSTVFWVLVIPAIVLAISAIYLPLALMLTCYLLLMPIKIWWVKRRMSSERKIIPYAYGFLTFFGKYPEMLGATKFFINLIFNKKNKIIEYK